MKLQLGKPPFVKLGKGSFLNFFVKSLHKMVTPPFYEVPTNFFPVHFLSEKRDDFEGCLKGVDGCFKGVWRVLQGV